MAATLSTLAKCLRSLLWLLFFVVVFNFGYDALFFHGVLKSPSRTPGYSSNWLVKPYTNVRLFSHRHRVDQAERFRNDWALVDVTVSTSTIKSIATDANKKGNALADRIIKP